MICLETRHFNIHRILLLVMGLWPFYQRSPIVQLQLILILGIVISFIISQFATLLTSKCTPEIIHKILSTSLFCVCGVIKYNSFWMNAETVRVLLINYTLAISGIFKY
ncbi:PREDICTED: uncharacterized protein LOC105557881 [Vollenhovia emeryi]|uniref:uncharacterized protein LOC105557881 n=1 Tax=Vollenhovia emeryi TaxID=411798 RepID=UPI0005F51C63|nr:PREDICTED: uncharacterized protein LOC105557881 [Vollenhovia emeryi]